MINVTICLGSNCGDRELNIKSTIGWLRELLIQVRCSDVYETPCAREGESKYLNAVMTGFFQGTGEGLEELLKEKEGRMGRDVHCREKGEVPIDIDIVICNGEIWKEWDYRQKFFQRGYGQIKTS